MPSILKLIILKLIFKHSQLAEVPNAQYFRDYSIGNAYGKHTAERLQRFDGSSRIPADFATQQRDENDQKQPKCEYWRMVLLSTLEPQSYRHFAMT